MNTYTPPASGRAAQSSPYVSAPNRESTPPSSQTISAGPTAPPVCLITLPGTRKIPDPIAILATANARSLVVRVRRSDGDCIRMTSNRVPLSRKGEGSEVRSGQLLLPRLHQHEAEPAEQHQAEDIRAAAQARPLLHA